MGRIRRTQSRSTVRRRQIIAAALKCFIETGVSGTPMEAIRKRSGASTGSIYHHFKSKEELAAAVYLEGLSHYQAGLIAELMLNHDARGGIMAMVRFHLTWVQENPDWARYLFQMRRAPFIKAREAAIQEKNQVFMDQLTAWFRPRIRRGSIRRLPGDLYPSLILGPCQEFVREWLAGEIRTEVDTAARIIGEGVWRSVRGTDEPGKEDSKKEQVC